MPYSILWSLQKKECSLTVLLGNNTNPGHNACVQYRHLDLSRSIHVVFFCLFNFLNISSSFDSHMVLHSKHFPVTFFFGIFGLSVLFFCFSWQVMYFCIRNVFTFLFSFFGEFSTGVFLVTTLLTGGFDGCPCCVSTVFFFSRLAVIFVNFFCFRHYSQTHNSPTYWRNFASLNIKKIIFLL